MTPLRFNRRSALALSSSALAGLAFPRILSAAGPPEMIAYRNPGCGCCSKWAMGLQADGFLVKLVDDTDLAGRRAAAGVPADLAGCHTAFLGNYVIEGHVPSEDIVRFLKEKPDALGLAVPGMPLGSPGMETAGAPDKYDVILFKADGSRRVFASH
ncbi:MAG: DUF411 domain-containing protein [Aestuariivirga sp.]